MHDSRVDRRAVLHAGAAEFEVARLWRIEWESRARSAMSIDMPQQFRLEFGQGAVRIDGHGCESQVFAHAGGPLFVSTLVARPLRAWSARVATVERTL